MATDRIRYDASLEVSFDIQDGIDIVNWTDPDTGQSQHRMTGIYPDIVTEEDIKAHWAYNLVANGVTDASILDGWGDLPKGAITFRLPYLGVEIGR